MRILRAIEAGRRGWRTSTPGVEALRSIRLSKRGSSSASRLARSSKTWSGQTCSGAPRRRRARPRSKPSRPTMAAGAVSQLGSARRPGIP
ncbi:hypothetical protein [Methylobacterium sp. WL1]|uniref:hypothetical protein n=1 Tax=Methylobacterium sp. WL1 TaxID=2603276 RepID=UPI001FF00CC5|nr:hypothetical protein [Methylobacterium sp. WL1]